MLRVSVFTLLVPLTAAAQGQRDSQIRDPDTRAWWKMTEALSDDSMEGRDTGSVAYEHAAQLVASRFQKEGLKPAGDGGTYFQSVPLHEVEVTREGTEFRVLRKGGDTALQFLGEISVRAADSLPSSIEGSMVFRGYCSKGELGNVTGKIVVCFNSRRHGHEGTRAEGALAQIQVDDPYFNLEPPRWPAAYARSVSIAGTPPTKGPVALTLSAKAFSKLLEGSDKNADQILSDGGHTRPLAPFDLDAKLQIKLHTSSKDYSSKNVLAILPGTDPKLAGEHLVLSAHLDGYGYGEQVGGDKLYNGTLDDAAYVALLIQFAAREHGRGLRRSVLFCAFTGEEKGLLGSRYFVAHPTVPKESLAADVNLDQLRPLFPLNILTTLAVNESTLGQTARDVAGPMDIQIRPDPEPERNLLRRADHWPFMQIGVPSVGFIFGYEPGTDAEKKYREWYQVRYHRPQDDVTQPMDFDAATKFNTFFYRLSEKVANADERPRWSEGSSYKPAN